MPGVYLLYYSGLKPLSSDYLIQSLKAIQIRTTAFSDDFSRATWVPSASRRGRACGMWHAGMLERMRRKRRVQVP